MISYTLPAGLTLSHFDDGGTWPWRDGKPIRSVSKILDRIYPLPEKLDPWYLKRGKLVHAATVYIDQGLLSWEELDEKLLPFCQAYNDFLLLVRPIIEATELNVVHPSYAFGARLDRVFRLHDVLRPIVTDIKCGVGKEDRYWLQVAACACALDEEHVQDYDLALLNLDNKGHPHFTVAPHPGSWINQWRQVLEADNP